MIDACKIDGKDCPNRPSYHYTWEWGEEGLCCDEHKTVLETRRGQLGRAITFSSLSRRREYAPPRLSEVPADVGALKMKLSEEMEQRKKLEQQIARLENERERSITQSREQDLRIQDLVKQNGELKAAVANAELRVDAAAELGTGGGIGYESVPRADEDAKSETREVIEGAADVEPPTPSTHGSKGKRR